MDKVPSLLENNSENKKWNSDRKFQVPFKGLGDEDDAREIYLRVASHELGRMSP